MLLAGPRAVQVLVQRSTCSRLLVYRSLFGGHRVSKPLAGRGAFEDCIEGLGAIFNERIPSYDDITFSKALVPWWFPLKSTYIVLMLMREKETDTIVESIFKSSIFKLNKEHI
ncbi:hypothetical protein YC2023_052734 [Brassica napus]